MLGEHLKKSLHLNKSQFRTFIGSFIILVFGSILTVFLMFPVFVAGLEGMYLRLRKGQKIKATDIFMYTGKFSPLLGTSLLIALDIFLLTIVLLIAPLILFLGFFILTAKFEPTNPIIIMIAAIFSLGYSIVILYREAQYIHAFNFVAELDLGPRESLRESKKAIESKWEAALLSFLLLFSFGCIFSFLSPYPILLKMGYFILGLLLFLVVVGATAMAFAHHVESQTRDKNIREKLL